jgi:acyl-CoA thioesterase-1
MRAAPNLGPEYAGKFDAIYPDLARQFSRPLYPFFLEGVAGHADLELSDGMHPNRQGVEKIVAGILPDVEALIRDVAANRKNGSAAQGNPH